MFQLGLTEKKRTKRTATTSSALASDDVFMTTINTLAHCTRAAVKLLKKETPEFIPERPWRLERVDSRLRRKRHCRRK